MSVSKVIKLVKDARDKGFKFSLFEPNNCIGGICEEYLKTKKKFLKKTDIGCNTHQKGRLNFKGDLDF